VAAFHEHCEAVMGCYRHVLVTVDGTKNKDQVSQSATLSLTRSTPVSLCQSTERGIPSTAL
jgi:hypothetical protein